MYSSSSCMSGLKDGKTWPIFPLQHVNFNHFDKPRNMSQSSVRREVTNLRILLSARDDSLTKQLEEAKNAIEVLHHIVDEKTKLLRETAVAIEKHEEYQRSQEHECRTKIEKMESYIRLLEVRIGFHFHLQLSHSYYYPRVVPVDVSRVWLFTFPSGKCQEAEPRMPY